MRFPRLSPHSELAWAVSHCDRESECLLGGEPHILLEGELGPLDEDSDRSDDGEDLGEMPEF